MLHRRRISAIIGALVLSTPPCTAAPAPTGLMVDLLEFPKLGEISVSHPTFTWALSPEIPSICAHQIQVHDANSIVWDSGKVPSSASVSIPYGGLPLQPSHDYAWRVRAWDAEEKRGEWSAFQEFRTAAKLLPYTPSVYRVQAVSQAPAAVRPTGSDSVLFDFGQDAFGWLELEIDAARAASVIVRLGEKLTHGKIDRDPGGTIRHAEAGLQLSPGKRVYRVDLPPDQRNTGPDAIPIPKDFGVILPFRWVEVAGIAPGSVAARRVALFYPFQAASSSFRSSDPTLNAVWDLCKYSIAATTFAGLYVDGDRERIPYEADAYINQLCHYNVDREFTLARASHEYLLEHPTWPTEWKQHSVMMAWQDYLHTGDKRSREAAYDSLRKGKIYLDRQRPDGLLDTGGLRDIVDWPVGERDGYDMRSVNTVVNAFFFHTMELMERIARALGKTQDAEEFAARARRSKDAVNSLLFDEDRGVYVDGEGSEHASSHANFFPLAFGVVPRDRVRTALDFVASRGMACSVYGAQYLLEALYRAGDDDLALKWMTAGGDRSWQAMIDAGSTITLEAWNSKAKPNLDWNHAWGAAPANIIPRHLMGVRPLEPGFAEVLIAPQIGSLEWAEAKIPTIRGAILVRAEQTANSFAVDFEIPGNTTAQVSVPDRGGSLLLDGKPVHPARANGRLIVHGVPSGSHRVEQRWMAADFTH